MASHVPELTPAEQHARDEQLPVLALTTFDLVHTASGHPMIVEALDGSSMLIRLATPEEFHAQHVAAVEAQPEFCRPPIMSLEEAARLVRPIGVAS